MAAAPCPPMQAAVSSSSVIDSFNLAMSEAIEPFEEGPALPSRQ